MEKRTIAREWLIFLLSIFVGLVIIPVTLSLLTNTINVLGNFYSALFTLKISSYKYNGEFFIAWVTVIFPYAAVQVVRSIIWSIKQLKTKS